MGTLPLPNPLDITITETDCGPAAPAVASNMFPAHGATTSSMSPTLSVDFDKPVLTTAGVITLTGNISTNLSYDLATSPSQVTFTNLNQTMNINPGIAFPAGENITVSWTNLRDAECGKDIPPPTWTFTIITPPCSPGSGGMVGTNLSSISTGLSSMSEYYVAADTDANGYVYVGNTTMLYRLPKAGGALQDVVSSASLTASHLGYAMLINGDDIFVVNESITTTGVLWRISTTGGTTWTIQDYVSFPSTPTGDVRGVYHYSGKIYMVTHGSTTVNTQIWSVDDTSAVLPVTAVLEGTVTGEGDCSGIAVDDDYIYLACGSSERVVRLARAAAPNFTSTLLFDNQDMSSTANDIFAVDTDFDGVSDILYVHGWYEEIYFVCEPDGVAYFDTLVSHGGASSSYGMGFDRVANALWVFDDDTREFTKVQ